VRYYKKKEEIDRRKADIQPIGESLKALMKAYRLDGKLGEVQLVQNWEKIMGKPIAMKTQQLYFKDGKLFVRLTSAPLKHELNMSKSKVIELLNTEAGSDVVKDVVFL
jgi:predicted nucleic acid-binding Zn ribbon protein